MWKRNEKLSDYKKQVLVYDAPDDNLFFKRIIFKDKGFNAITKKGPEGVQAKDKINKMIFQQFPISEPELLRVLGDIDPSLKMVTSEIKSDLEWPKRLKRAEAYYLKNVLGKDVDASSTNSSNSTATSAKYTPAKNIPLEEKLASSPPQSETNAMNVDSPQDERKFFFFGKY